MDFLLSPFLPESVLSNMISTIASDLIKDKDFKEHPSEKASPPLGLGWIILRVCDSWGFPIDAPRA
jgi:hypothetical protein